MTSGELTACQLCSTVMPAVDYRRHYLEAHDLEAERPGRCVLCGRPIPERWVSTTIAGAHPGCHRKAVGRPPR